MKMEVDVNEDEVVAASLQDTLEYIEDCILSFEYSEAQATWKHSWRIFDNDPEEDLKQLKKFRKALKKVISWYTV